MVGEPGLRPEREAAGEDEAVVLGDNPSWVDDAGVGPTTLLLPPGSRLADAKLFWNNSLDRMLLLPGAKPPDISRTSTIAGTRDEDRNRLKRCAIMSCLR